MAIMFPYVPVRARAGITIPQTTVLQLPIMTNYSNHHGSYQQAPDSTGVKHFVPTIDVDVDFESLPVRQRHAVCKTNGSGQFRANPRDRPSSPPRPYLLLFLLFCRPPPSHLYYISITENQMAKYHPELEYAQSSRWLQPLPSQHAFWFSRQSNAAMHPAIFGIYSCKGPNLKRLAFFHSRASGTLVKLNLRGQSGCNLHFHLASRFE